MLEPPDPNRCQAETLQYNPLIMGGNPYRRMRCQNRPDWLIVMTKGEPGHMTMCDDCAEVFIRLGIQNPSHYTMEWLDAAPPKG